ncbi:unnamed protein product [Toxocara canis]|uniref:TYR_PHOSPHATASE_2 domain-containing protein n=1 Tax=Toxocara canis TaxID=6265 RepID=A0A183TV68_TOXCA|nr:unnamed protein product [Toxocara canis]
MDGAKDNLIVKASYSTVRSGIIRLTPESIQCRLYCRGANCKYCSCKHWKASEQAIRGIYSSWITDKIVAMARPTTETFINYNFIGQLKEMNIRTIINMQTAGEHAFCGPALLPSGFTYDPEVLMENKIYFYNFDWPDFGALGLELLLNVVKVMHFATSEGNVAVHCHAGLGRTGVIVASYLVWRYQLSSAEAINYVRKKRPHSVQSSTQIELINAFWYFLLNDARVIPRRGVLSLCDYLQLQGKVLCNSEARRYNHIPKKRMPM